jgi:pimeloyl-ACP methyl ester carboxylesterase
MIDPRNLRLSDLHGAVRLGVDATAGMTDLVEAMHAAIARPDLGLRGAASARTAGISGLVYRSIRGVTGLTGAGLDAVLGRPGVEYERTSVEREAVIAALNGVLGDHLATTANPLAIPMRLHHAGRPLTLRTDALSRAVPESGAKLLILAHGLCMNDLQWTRDGHDHGAMLADALGYTPLYLHYNTGLSIAENGRNFAELLETLQAQWPTPVDEITLIGHSMGGLLARSACQHAAGVDHRWIASLRNLVCMGSPHHGAPLERGGRWIDLVLGATPFASPLARVGKLRSAGITDLSHGATRPARSRRRASPLPHGVRCFAIAATTGSRRGDLKDRWIGDGLVPVESALGHHHDPERVIGFPRHRQWIGYGMHHLDLLDHPDVADRLLRWLRPRAARQSPAAESGRAAP